jgi:hypothetical protein
MPAPMQRAPCVEPRSGRGVGMGRRVLLIGVLLCAGLPALATARPAQLARSVSASVSAGRLLWVSCPASDCSLWTRAGGVTSRLPTGPFVVADDAEDAELGVGPHGRPVAAYPRCNASLRDCDVYVYDFTAGAERRLPVSAAHGAITTPTVSGNRIAYAFNPGGRDADTPRFHLYWSFLDGRKMHRIRTMPFALGIGPPTLDLAGRLLTYGGYTAQSSCFGQSQVRIARLGSRAPDRLVAQGSERTEVFSPHWARGVIYYGRDFFTSASYRHDFTRREIVRSRVERYAPRTHRAAATRYTTLAITAVLPGADRLMYQLVTRRRRADGLYAADFPAFRPLRRGNPRRAPSGARIGR